MKKPAKKNQELTDEDLDKASGGITGINPGRVDGPNPLSLPKSKTSIKDMNLPKPGPRTGIK